jgi:hypothetical protein
MLDKNYLNHNLTPQSINTPTRDVYGWIYNCSVCKVSVVFWDYHSAFGDNKYFIHLSHPPLELDLTCEEFIIKKLLE